MVFSCAHLKTALEFLSLTIYQPLEQKIYEKKLKNEPQSLDSYQLITLLVNHAEIL